MHGHRVQPGGQPGVDHLAAIAHRGVKGVQVHKAVGGQAALLGQLPLGGLKGLLPGLQLPGGQLPQFLPQGVAVLAHQIHLVLLGEGQHAGPAVVVHHLPGGGGAVLQPHLVQCDGKNVPGEPGLAGKRLFKMAHGVPSCVQFTFGSGAACKKAGRPRRSFSPPERRPRIQCFSWSFWPVPGPVRRKARRKVPGRPS